MEKILFKNTFEEKASKVHNNKYDYSLSDYDHSRKKVVIICPIHGEFMQTPSLHISGHGCKKCAYILLGEKAKMTLEQFLEKAKEVHGEKYDYSLACYYNTKTPINIICDVHGTFEQRPNAHLMGKGCKKCGFISTHNSNITHGFSNHPLFHTWNGIIRRCNNPETINYKDYGGRGIKISQEFLFSFESFADYVSSLPRYKDKERLKLSMDRIDNDGNYERGNLRWATQKEQNSNRRLYINSKYKGIKVFGNAFKASIIIQLGEFSTLEEALSARNEYIKNHNLPHKIQ